MGFILLSGLAKLGFHRAHVISSKVPESCLLIILGVLFGGLLYLFFDDECSFNQRCLDYSHLVFPKFTPDLFFLYLLPPIILEAAYCLHNKHFFDNIRSILLFAVVGTVINFLLTGGLLILVQYLGLIGFQEDSEGNYVSLSIVEILLFASLISAVDPVAVLSIFAEVGVNPDLYFLVFGESLLNDGVAVVLYNMMSVFAGMESEGIEVTSTQILLGFGSFFTVAFGGLGIGLFYGFITALITRLTSGVRIIEPLALLGGAYMAYITAELFHWSGIISLIGCGVIQAHYAFRNISSESLTTVNYFIKMLSSVSDCIIFLYLGMAFFEEHDWNTGFVCWTLVFILGVRFLTIYGLSFIINILRKNIHPIAFKEQFIMAYGGLRGAVGFSLVSMINQDHVPAAKMFITTTLAVVMFTVFLQGSTIKLFVNWLHIDKKGEEHVSLTEEINRKLFEHVMAGIEIICGKHGEFYAQHLFKQVDKVYLKKWFCVKNYDHSMKKIYEEVTLGDHFLHLYGPSLISKDNLNNNNMTDEQNGVPNTTFQLEANSNGKDLRIKQYSKLESDTLDLEMQQPNSTPTKNLTPRSHKVMNSHKDEDRNSLKRALKNDPVKKLHQVYDRNLVNVAHRDVNLHLKKRRESALLLKEKIITINEDGSMRKQIKPEDLPLLDQKLETMREEERFDVNVLLEHHHELRKRKSKSAGSLRRYTQKPFLVHQESTTPSITEQDETGHDPDI